MKKIIRSRKDIGRKLKLRLVYALILPIAIYATEIWALTKENTRVLEVFENNCLRSFLNINLLDRISINRMHRAADTEYDVQNIIRKRRLAWFGHVCRFPDDFLVNRSLKEDFEKKI